MKELDNYKQAVFQLADKLHSLKKEKGRFALLTITGMDLAKINQLTTIGSFINRTHNLLPEHYLEVAGLLDSEANKFLTIAVKESLTPCQLRKVVREKTSKVKTVKKKVRTNGFIRHLEQLKRELNKMDEGTKNRAKELLKQV